MIHSADITFQMLEDWRNVDLNSITKQTLYTMEDSRDEHRKLIIQCKMSHQGLLSFRLVEKRKEEKVSWEMFKWHSHPGLPRGILSLLLFLFNGSAQMGSLIDLRGHVSRLGGKMVPGATGQHRAMQKAPQVTLDATHSSIGGMKKERIKACHLSVYVSLESAGEAAGFSVRVT